MQAYEVVSATADWRACLEPQVDFTLPQDSWAEILPLSVSEEGPLVEGKALSWLTRTARSWTVFVRRASSAKQSC